MISIKGIIFVIFSFVIYGTNLHVVRGQCLSPNDDLSLATDVSLSSIQDFNIDLFRRLIPENPEENFVLSPYSVWNALVLAYFGSSDNTAAQFRNVLHVPDKVSVLRQWRQLEMLYRMRPDTTTRNTFALSNRIYFDKEVILRRCLRNILHNEIKYLDFKNEPIQSADAINRFVNRTTRGHITQMVSANDVRAAHLVLVNAAYFKGIWEHPFDVEQTQTSTFTAYSGEQIPVKMMTQFGKFRYGYDDELQTEVLELPYSGENITMYIFLPYKNDMEGMNELIRLMNAEVIESIVSRMFETNVRIRLPRFSIATMVEEQLIQALYGMGLRDAFFSYKANFIDFSFYRNLKLDHSIHKAFINVNEEGTEAGAATAFVALKTRASEFNCNRPFLFAIRDKITQNLLFMGTLRKPTAVSDSPLQQTTNINQIKQVKMVNDVQQME